MRPFKIQKKVLHFFNDKVLYENSWQDTVHREDSEEAAYKLKQRLEKEAEGKAYFRVIPNEV